MTSPEGVSWEISLEHGERDNSGPLRGAPEGGVPQEKVRPGPIPIPRID